MSTHNLCFEQKYKKYQNFLSENFYFLVVKFSVYLNRNVFIMYNRVVELVRFMLLIPASVIKRLWCNYKFTLSIERDRP